MSEKRKRILNLLEEGHITAEEADRLMDSLDEEADEKGAKQENNEGYFQSDFKEDVRSFTKGVKHFLDDTFQRIKEGPFEFNFNHTLIRRDYSFHAGEVDYFNFDLANTTLEFLPTGSNEISIECKAKVFKESDFEKAEKTFEQNFEIDLVGKALQIGSPNKHIQTQLVIYLPKKTFDKASFKSINGSIKIRAAHFKQASVSTVNGSIEVYEYTGDSFYAETNNGSIRLDDVHLSKAKLGTTTGSIFMDGDVEQVNISVTTGSIRSYIRNKDAKIAHVQTVTGSVQMYVPEDAPIVGTANTSFSSIDIHLEGVTKHYLDEQMMKKLIQFSNTDSDQEHLDIDLSTKTGSIRVYPIN